MIPGYSRPVACPQTRWTTTLADGFLRRIEVAHSQDLSRWQRVGAASLAQLDYLGRHFERRSVDLHGIRARYLRLSWSGEQPPFQLTRVEALTAATVSQPRRLQHEVQGTVEASERGLFLFDLGGPVPVDRVRVVLPELNTLVEATVESAAAAEGRWRKRFAGTLYRVRYDGEEMASDAMAVARSRDRFWRLRVDAKGGGLGAGRPTLQVSWVPEQLLFVSRGEGPFTLAYGSHAASPSSFDAASLIGLVPGQALAALKQSTAQLTRDPFTLAGEAALVPPTAGVSWRLLLLWGMLLGGVALLGWMTLRLVRQLTSSADAGS